MPLDPLAPIMKFESGGQNVPNYRYDSTHTAGGFFQITNSTWKDTAPAAGVDLGQFPTAMSAPFDVQKSVATTLYNQRGFQPWEPNNPSLASYISQQGGAGAFVPPGQLTSAGFGVNDPSAATGINDPSFAPSDPNALVFHMTPKGSGSSGAGAGLNQAGKPSQTVPEAIDKQTAGDKANTASVTGTALNIYGDATASLSDYFVRAAFILVGVLFLWAGLRMFGLPVPGPGDVVKGAALAAL